MQQPVAHLATAAAAWQSRLGSAYHWISAAKPVPNLNRQRVTQSVPSRHVQQAELASSPKPQLSGATRNSSPGRMQRHGHMRQRLQLGFGAGQQPPFQVVAGHLGSGGCVGEAARGEAALRWAWLAPTQPARLAALGRVAATRERGSITRAEGSFALRTSTQKL